MGVFLNEIFPKLLDVGFLLLRGFKWNTFINNVKQIHHTLIGYQEDLTAVC